MPVRPARSLRDLAPFFVKQLCRMLATATLLFGMATIANAQESVTTTLRVSLYYAALESDYPVGEDAAFLDGQGRELHRASAEFVRSASIEGSARLNDGRTLVFDPAQPERGWAPSNTPLGLDALGCALTPFRTAAVAPEIPLGTELFIPETVGLPLPGGGEHDGYWFATDRGVGIEGDRIDLFMATGKASMRTGEAFGLHFLTEVHAQVVGRVHGCPSDLAPGRTS